MQRDPKYKPATTILEHINDLVLLAEDCMRLMEVGATRRLRTSTQNLILRNYGSNSAFFFEFQKIGDWESQGTLNEIKGGLLAMRDDIALGPVAPSESIRPHKNGVENEKMDILTGLLLRQFYDNAHYNWEAISNLIKLNADYFDFTIVQADLVFKKFIERNIIAYTGLGKAYCITTEGKRLYELKFKVTPPDPHQPVGQVEVEAKSPTAAVSLSSDKPIGMTDVFVSYSWDSPDHQEKVKAFVNFLRENGYDASMDLMLSEKQTAIDFAKMMHQAMQQARKIIIILSAGYKRKAESFSGGVGQEYSMLFKDIDNFPQKYILISFGGTFSEIVPFGLQAREIVDCNLDDWEQKLFAKLDDKIRHLFSEVAPSKPTIETISPKRFSDLLDNKSQKIKRDNVAKIQAGLIMEEKLKTDIVDQKMMAERTDRVGMYPGTSTIFVTNRVIIRSVDDSQYPMVDDSPSGRMSSWVREHFYDMNSEGIEIWLSAALGTKIIMDGAGNWEILQAYDDYRQHDPQYKTARIMAIGLIPYYAIVGYRKSGDEYYNEPHLFCEFEFDGTPYNKVRYQVYFDETADLPTYTLNIRKKTKFPTT